MKIKVNYDIQYESFTNEKGEIFKIGDTAKLNNASSNYGYIIAIFDNAVLVSDTMSQLKGFEDETLSFYKKTSLKKTDYIYIPKILPKNDFIKSTIEFQKYNSKAHLN